MNKKRIAKNTVYLYIRMLFSMVVTLYTSRVVLNVLGVEDFGTYNVVAGFVILFGFFNSAMSSATQRFLAFEIGRSNTKRLKETFNATFNIHLVIAVVILFFAETIGLWFVNNKLNIPIQRMDAVNWVYQFSIFTFLLNVVRVPFSALIIANERMIAYAYLSIVEVISNLFTVFMLYVFLFDKLKLYSTLVFLVTLSVLIFYVSYCLKYFKESRYKFYFERKLYGTLISYSGWNLFGNIAAVAKNQGVNVLLNIFFGTVINAAYGISMQVFSAVNVFIVNFQLAISPQIIKNYSVGNSNNSIELIFQGSKFSFFLVYILSVPILFETDFILGLWLNIVPNHTSKFVVLVIINLLIDSLSGTLMTGAQATGKIKYYQMVIGTLLFLNLPISFFLLKYYTSPESVFYVSIILSMIALLFRIYFLNKLLGMSIKEYFSKVLIRVIIVVVLSIFVPFVIHNNIFLNDGIYRFFTLCISSILIILLFILLFGLSKKERKRIKEMICIKSRLS